MPTYLVTGAQGFVGRYLVAELLRSDPEAFVLGLGRSRGDDTCFTHVVRSGTEPVSAPLPRGLLREKDSEQYRYVALDLARGDELTGLLASYAPTVVFHLASGLRDDLPARLVESTVKATRGLFEAIGRTDCPPERVVLGSSGAVYGNVIDLPISEASPCNPVDPYGACKLSAEREAQDLAARSGTLVIRARIFNLVGPGQDERHVCGRLASIIAGIASGLLPPRLEVGDLEPTRDFIDVRDAARALTLLGTCPGPDDAYNVATGKETKIRVILDTLLRIAGVGDVSIVRRTDIHPSQVDRHVADVTRLLHLGFSPEYGLNRSLTDLLRYYSELNSLTNQHKAMSVAQ